MCLRTGKGHRMSAYVTVGGICQRERGKGREYVLPDRQTQDRVTHGEVLFQFVTNIPTAGFYRDNPLSFTHELL